MSVVLQTLSSYDPLGFSKPCKPHTPLLFVGHGAVQLPRKGLQETHFEYKDTDTLKVQGWEKRCYADSKHRKLKIKAGFKVRSINRGNPPKHSHPIPVSLPPLPWHWVRPSLQVSCVLRERKLGAQLWDSSGPRRSYGRPVSPQLLRPPPCSGTLSPLLPSPPTFQALG